MKQRFLYSMSKAFLLERKVEGAKTNIPPKINTYKRLSIANALLSWTVPHGVGVYMPIEWQFLGAMVAPSHSGLHYMRVG